MRRALHVAKRTANDGRERAAAVTVGGKQIQQLETFGLVSGPQVASAASANNVPGRGTSQVKGAPAVDGASQIGECRRLARSGVMEAKRPTRPGR
jgi:hypothetical protein